MAIKRVRVRNRLNGAVATLPESALPNLPDWQPVDGPPPDRPKPKKQIKPTGSSESSVSNENEELSNG